MSRKTLAIIIIVAAILGVGSIPGMWLLRWWVIREINTHAWAGTQCAIVASAVCERLRGQQQVDDGTVAAVVADLARTEGEHYSSYPHASALLDPWGTPLSVRVERIGDDYVLLVRSAGPDGVMGNGDDYLWDNTRWPVEAPPDKSTEDTTQR